MNAKHIESRFAAMGARLKVREIASRWQMGDRRWIDPVNYAVDIRRDRDGAFFELRLPAHLSEAVEATVLQSEPKQRHLLLLIRKTDEKPIASCAGTTNVNGSSQPCQAVRRVCVRRWMHSSRRTFVMRSRAIAFPPARATNARTAHFAVKASGSSCPSRPWWWTTNLSSPTNRSVVARASRTSWNSSCAPAARRF